MLFLFLVGRLKKTKLAFFLFLKCIIQLYIYMTKYYLPSEIE